MAIFRPYLTVLVDARPVMYTDIFLRRGVAAAHQVVVLYTELDGNQRGESPEVCSRLARILERFCQPHGIVGEVLVGVYSLKVLHDAGQTVVTGNSVVVIQSTGK